MDKIIIINKYIKNNINRNSNNDIFLNNSSSNINSSNGPNRNSN